MADFSMERAHRAANVTMVLTQANITIQDLIDQLILHGRIKQIDYHARFYAELVEDESYMEGVDRSIVHGIGQALDNDLLLTWTDDKRSESPECERIASIGVLVPEKHHVEDDPPKTERV